MNINDLEEMHDELDLMMSDIKVYDIAVHNAKENKEDLADKGMYKPELFALMNSEIKRCQKERTKYLTKYRSKLLDIALKLA